MSPHHRMSSSMVPGPKARLTRSTAAAASGSWMVVVLKRLGLTPMSPGFRISRATRLRPAGDAGLLELGVDPGSAVGTPGVPVESLDALGEGSVAALPLARCVRCALVVGGPGNFGQPAGRCHGPLLVLLPR